MLILENCNAAKSQKDTLTKHEFHTETQKWSHIFEKFKWNIFPVVCSPKSSNIKKRKIHLQNVRLLRLQCLFLKLNMLQIILMVRSLHFSAACMCFVSHIRFFHSLKKMLCPNTVCILSKTMKLEINQDLNPVHTVHFKSVLWCFHVKWNGRVFLYTFFFALFYLISKSFLHRLVLYLWNATSQQFLFNSLSKNPVWVKTKEDQIISFLLEIHLSSFNWSTWAV